MASEAAQAAAAIRKELKKNGIKASVKSSSYAGGTSVSVEINEDVLPATRREIELFCDQYQCGHFDGMSDIYEYSNRREGLPQAKYVLVAFNYSDEIKKAAAAYFGEVDGLDDWARSQQAYRVLTGDISCDFWNSRKPRLLAAA